MNNTEPITADRVKQLRDEWLHNRDIGGTKWLFTRAAKLGYLRAKAALKNQGQMKLGLSDEES